MHGVEWMREYMGHELIISKLGDEYMSSLKTFLTFLQIDKKKIYLSQEKESDGICNMKDKMQ